MICPYVLCLYVMGSVLWCTLWFPHKKVCWVRLYLQLLYRRAYVLFTLFVFVWFVFTSSCCTGGLMSYLRYLCLLGSSLPPVVVQEGSCLIYVICVCLYIVVFNTCWCFCVVWSSSCVPYVASFSGLSISDCSFGILWVVHLWFLFQYSLTFILSA